MDTTERRRHPRFETEMRVTIHTTTESIPAIMIDIAKYSIGLISGKEIQPGTRVDISLKYIDDYAVQGTVKWLEEIQEVPNYLYRMGIEADNILFLKEIADLGLPERSEYVKWMISAEKTMQHHHRAGL